MISAVIASEKPMDFAAPIRFEKKKNMDVEMRREQAFAKRRSAARSVYSS